MITDQQLASALRGHYTEEPASRPDAERMTRGVLDRIHGQPQGGNSWWPVRRRAVVAADGHGPAVRTTPTFSAARFAVAGVILALVGGALVVAQPFTRPVALPGAAPDDPGTFSPTGSLAQPRAGHSATLLPDGRVLVVGGVASGPAALRRRSADDDESLTSTAEVWDPDTDTFSPTGSLADGRGYHSATLLPDGRVLVVGGQDWGHAEFAEDYITSAEVWDPSTGAFSPAGSPEFVEIVSTTLLADGRVLVVGRADTGDGRPIRMMPASTEIWDPATDSFGPVDLDVGADYHAATALADGRVLITNDEDPTGSGYSGPAVVWDPVTDTVSPAGSPLPPRLIEVAESAREDASTTLLADGRVLVIGWLPNCESDGSAKGTAVDCGRTSIPEGASSLAAAAGTDCRPDCISWAEVWDPATSTYRPAGLLPGASRERFTVTALADGGALIAGGCSDNRDCYSFFDSAEVWDPDTETFDPTGSLAVTRFTHTATALPDGRVLVVGGLGGDVGNEETLASAEVWEPSDG